MLSKQYSARFLNSHGRATKFHSNTQSGIIKRMGHQNGGVAGFPKNPQKLCQSGFSKRTFREVRFKSGRAEGDGTKVTERERESPKRRFSQKTADFRRFTPPPGNSSMIWRAQETAENRSFSQKTEDFRRKLQEPQIGLRHLRSVTFSSALSSFRRGTIPGANPGPSPMRQECPK